MVQKISRRRVTSQHSTLLVSVPKLLAKLYGIVPGDIMVVYVDDQNRLVFQKEDQEEEVDEG